MRASSSSLMISNTRTTCCTPGTVRAISAARLASRWVTRPIMYTTPRSVVTLIALADKSLASMKDALTRVVINVSAERTPKEGSPITPSSSTISRTFSTWATKRATSALSVWVGTVPVINTRRLKLLTITRPRSPSASLTAARARSSIPLSSTCMPVVRRSVATTTPVPTAPPTTKGAHAVKTVLAVNTTAAMPIQRLVIIPSPRAFLRPVVTHQCHRASCAAPLDAVPSPPQAWSSAHSTTHRCRASPRPTSPV